MRHENQELSTKMREEAKVVVREEMETVHTEMKEHLEKSDQVFRQHQVVVSPVSYTHLSNCSVFLPFVVLIVPCFL